VSWVEVWILAWKGGGGGTEGGNGHGGKALMKISFGRNDTMQRFYEIGYTAAFYTLDIKYTYT